MADNYYWIRLERKVQLNQLKYADEVKEVLWGNGLIPQTAPYAVYEGSYKSNGEWKDAVLVVSKASRRTVLHRCLFRREMTKTLIGKSHSLIRKILIKQNIQRKSIEMIKNTANKPFF